MFNCFLLLFTGSKNPSPPPVDVTYADVTIKQKANRRGRLSQCALIKISIFPVLRTVLSKSMFKGLLVLLKAENYCLYECL